MKYGAVSVWSGLIRPPRTPPAAELRSLLRPRRRLTLVKSVSTGYWPGSCSLNRRLATAIARRKPGSLAGLFLLGGLPWAPLQPSLQEFTAASLPALPPMPWQRSYNSDPVQSANPPLLRSNRCSGGRSRSALGSRWWPQWCKSQPEGSRRSGS